MILQQTSDQYINHLNNQVQTFPPFEEDALHTVKYGVPIENIWDLTTNDNKQKRSNNANKKQSISVSDMNSMVQMQSR